MAGTGSDVSLASIELVVLDVDGVLTDGRLQYGADGQNQAVFHVRDGAGIVRLLRSGKQVAIISGRGDAPLRARMKELGVTEVHTGVRDKAQALETLLKKLGISAERTLAMGDDLQDLPMLRRAGTSVAVADAEPAVRAAAHWVTSRRGGRGAVREVADAILNSEEPDFRVVIPARHDASRLPGKPLRHLAGRPMVTHVWDRAVESGATEIIVAADDQRIVDAISQHGGVALLTSREHLSGTDRVCEIARLREWDDDAIVVNLQGDEPCMRPELIEAAATTLTQSPGADIATIATPISERSELWNENAVKVVIDERGFARYFSRAPIPWVRGVAHDSTEALPPNTQFLRHIGIYAYRVGALKTLTALPQGQYETVESLEQLRALERGMRIAVTVTKTPPPPGVDTEDDLRAAESVLSQA